MLKKSLSLFLIFIIIFSISACSNHVEKVDIYSKYDYLKDVPEEDFMRFMKSVPKGETSNKELEYLIDLKIKDVSEKNQQVLIDYLITNSNILVSEYRYIIEQYKNDLLKNQDKIDFKTGANKDLLNNRILITTLDELYKNHLYLNYINNNLFINIDYSYILEKYKNYLSEDFIEFFRISEKLEQTQIFTEDSIIFTNVESIILDFQSFAKKYNSSLLFNSALQGYESQLTFYLGMYNLNGIFNEEGKIKEKAIEIYETFINNYPDNDLSQALMLHIENIRNNDNLYYELFDIDTRNLIIDLIQKVFINDVENNENDENISNKDEGYLENVLDAKDIKDLNLK